MLFTGAKVSQYAVLPQGQAEAAARVKNLVDAMASCGFGNCTNHYECQAACPKGINVKFIARMNRDYLGAVVRSAFQPESQAAGGGGA